MFMKKFIADLLVLLFIFGGLCAYAQNSSDKNNSKNVQPPFDGVLKQDSIKINSIDPIAGATFTGSFFPGGRGTNQLVVYTPKYGLRTGTNEFGAEAIVIDNTVVQISGADSIIPVKGFVISGHGKAKNWINENITVGSKIYLDTQNLKITAYLTNESFLFATKEKIKEVDQMIKYYKTNDYFYNDAYSNYYISKARDSLSRAAKKPDDTQKYSSQAITSANKALQHALPYYPEELKGIWVRPVETTPEDIKKTVNKIKSYGIKDIFLETYFQGKTIFPSTTLAKYKVQDQRTEFKGFDPLNVWITEAHNNGMKVHIWFETFYAGNENPMSNKLNVLNVYPQWGNMTKAKYNSNMPVASISEHNGYFLDPANPEVQNYLLCLINEIVTKYKPDGINLDYIRYPQSISAKFAGYELTNWGYTQYTRDDFEKSYGIDPIDIKYGTPEWEKWALYRQNKVTDFVAKTKEITKKNNILLTTVIFPDREKSLEIKMQDWRTWSVNRYIDGFTPLILTCDKETADFLISDIRKNSQPHTKIYPGLFVAFMNGNPDDLLRQIHESRKLKTSGVVMFDYAHLEPKYTDVLIASVFTKPEDVKASDIPRSTKRKMKKMMKTKNQQNKK